MSEEHAHHHHHHHMTPEEIARERYLVELLGTTIKTVERVIRRMDNENKEDRDTLERVLTELNKLTKDTE
jgi:hypothetical protein